jgi:hypothetical protein
MLDSLTFWLIVLAFLIAYLCVSVGLRVGHRLRAEEASRRALERQFPGRALDVSAIAPALKDVRNHYSEAARYRSRYAFWRAELLAAARRVIACSSYFRRERHEHKTHEHDA